MHPQFKIGDEIGVIAGDNRNHDITGNVLALGLSKEKPAEAGGMTPAGFEPFRETPTKPNILDLSGAESGAVADAGRRSGGLGGSAVGSVATDAAGGVWLALDARTPEAAVLGLRWLARAGVAG